MPPRGRSIRRRPLPQCSPLATDSADRQVDPQLHDRLVAEGLALLDREGVHGKDVTPRLLEYFHTHSGGESLRANVELVLSNARLAGDVAAELVALQSDSQ